MNIFKPTDAKTPEEYIEKIEEPRKSDFIKVYDLIKRVLPNDKPYIVANMIGFRSCHYKSKSGREGDWPIIALASQKNYISVYICGTKNGKYVAESHTKDFPKASIGKSCIRFKKSDDIDLMTLELVIKEGLNNPFGL